MQSLNKQIVCTQANIDTVVQTLIDAITHGQRIILLSGELGAGKTTLVQTLLGHFGVIKAPSPSFVIERVYDVSGTQKADQDTIKRIYHVDLFRLQNTKELHDLAFYPQLNEAQALIIIEWPELIVKQLKHYLSVKINYETKENVREYIIKEN